MCSDEACSTYNIPKPLMALFSQWAGKLSDFNDEDISALSLIVSLDEIGFSED